MKINTSETKSKKVGVGRLAAYSSLPNRQQCKEKYIVIVALNHISLASFLWDIDKQNSPRCDAAKRGVQSGAILLADMNFIEILNQNEKSLPEPLKIKDWKVHSSLMGYFD